MVVNANENLRDVLNESPSGRLTLFRASRLKAFKKNDELFLTGKGSFKIIIKLKFFFKNFVFKGFLVFLQHLELK